MVAGAGAGRTRCRTDPPELGRSVGGAGSTPADRLDPVATVRTGWSLLAVDRLDRCDPALHRVLDDGRHGGAVGSAINAAVLLHAVAVAVAAGRWDDACRLAEQGRALCVSNGHEAMAVLAGSGPALVAACRGDEVTCRDRTSRMTEWAAPRGARLVHHYAAYARVLAALGQGDAEPPTTTRARSPDPESSSRVTPAAG